MRILVLGGSYFLGKHFVLRARENYQITVFNRGTRPLELADIREVQGDRHDRKALEKLRYIEERGEQDGTLLYDVVVDFCAYQKGDIELLFEVLEGRFGQYIFISTCDVYQRGLQTLLQEEALLETRSFGGEAGEYIAGKVALEKELVRCAEQFQVSYTSLRPAFIYGPDNYAPREGIYFHWIAKAAQILHPVDATGQFQMVYVEDVVQAILSVIGNPHAQNQAYNLAPATMITYEIFADALAKCHPDTFDRVDIPLRVVLEKGIPLPFPLTKEESNWYDGRKALSLIKEYVELEDGLHKTIIQWKE